MKIFGLSVSVLGIVAAVSGVHAADLILDTPMVEPTVATTGIKGTLDVGVLGTYAEQSNWPFEGWAGGAYIGVSVWGASEGIYWGIDGYLEANSFADPYEEAPDYVGTVGGHLGFGTSDLMLGGFVSGGVTPDSQSHEAKGGYTVGVEGLVRMDTVDLFAQIGYAGIQGGPPGPNQNYGFNGGFVRVGAAFSLSDDFAVLADASYGYSDEFVDPGESGAFWSAGIKGAWRLPTDFDAFLTAGYEYQSYTAIGEDDGSTHTIKVGLSIPFGDSSTARDALNPLGTSAMPYRAGAWASTLD